jgi:hypothetical protein
MTKRILCLFIALASIGIVWAQVPVQQGQQPTADLPKFNLDFPGGPPQMLVQLINQELKKSPVNVIIPEEAKKVVIPPMKLKDVTVQQVFQALMGQSRRGEDRTVYSGDGRILRQEYSTSYFFQAVSPITTNTIWTLKVSEPPPKVEEPKVCRFYQLSPFLDQGLSVNDITTAIKAGYKMLGESNAPDLNFHEETRLLIAVGPESKLKLIDQVLTQLPKPKTEPSKTDPQKAEKPKA